MKTIQMLHTLNFIIIIIIIFKVFFQIRNSTENFLGINFVRFIIYFV